MEYLVAVDGSEPSTEALDYAIDLAERAGASITVVYAVEPRVRVEGGGSEAPTIEERDKRMYTEDIEVAEERGRDALDDAEERAAQAGVAVETELLYGDPVDSITEYADADVDAIVVGHRGLSDRIEGMVGSVAKGLVERAVVPVTVVK
ncbi:MAG: universal stress protein [Haloquadratum sp.]